MLCITEAWKSATGSKANSVFRSTFEIKEKQVTTNRKRKASEVEKKRRKHAKYK